MYESAMFKKSANEFLRGMLWLKSEFVIAIAENCLKKCVNEIERSWEIYEIALSWNVDWAVV